MNDYTDFQKSLILKGIITSPEDDISTYNPKADLDTTGFVLSYCKGKIPQKYISYAIRNYKKEAHKGLDYFQLFCQNVYQDTIPSEFIIFTSISYPSSAYHPFLLWLVKVKDINNLPLIIRNTIDWQNKFQYFYDRKTLSQIIQDFGFNTPSWLKAI